MKLQELGRAVSQSTGHNCWRAAQLRKAPGARRPSCQATGSQARSAFDLVLRDLPVETCVKPKHRKFDSTKAFKTAPHCNRLAAGQLS